MSGVHVELLGHEPMPVSRAHRWQHRILWICSIIALAFGTYGYLIYEHNGEHLRFIDALYHAAQHFMMHAPHLEGHIPWQLEVGRWLAAATTLAAVCHVFARRSREEWDALCIRFMRKEHTVICGLGRKGLASALKLKQQGKRVIVIEKSPASARLKACRRAGVRVLIGDAASRETLRAAYVHRAATLIALCPEDSANCLIARTARELACNETKRKAPLQCRILVGDPEARTAFEEWAAHGKAGCGGQVHFFDPFDPEARRLLTLGLPLDHDGIKPGDTRQVHLVILGFGRMGRAVAVRAAQLGIFAEPGRLKISVIDRLARKHEDELLFHHPQVRNVCDIEFHAMEAISPATRDKLKEWCAAKDCVTSVAVCFDNEARALDIAVQLRLLIEANDVRVAVRQSAEGGLAHLLGEASTGDEAKYRFHLFGATERSGDNGSLADDASEEFARAIHVGYQTMRRKQAQDNPVELAKVNQEKQMRDWDALSEDLRESNRQQADHIHIKLRALGYGVADANDEQHPEALTKFTKEHLDVLEVMEHRRWMAERQMANWTHGEPRDDARRKNPNLVKWEKLTPTVKAYDREAVAAIPELLRQAGKVICKQRNK